MSWGETLKRVATYKNIYEITTRYQTNIMQKNSQNYVEEITNKVVKYALDAIYVY